VRPDWEVVDEARNGVEALEKVQQLKPDIAILDFSMPLLEGPKVAKKMKEVSPETAVVVLTMHDTEHAIREVLSSGAKGYVLKSDADEDLVAAVDAVSQNRHFFTGKVANLLLDGFLVENPPELRGKKESAQLTLREGEVLALLAEGITSKQIATKLNISVRTVESHRIHINRKLGFGSLADLVRYALRHGLTSPN
jgi:DNA-binding NarL/FixJ family response regulator